MSEYDQRQYLLIDQTIQDYRSGRIGLGALIRNLRDLLNVLEEASDEWRAQYYDAWWTLEQFFAVSLDRSDPSIISENKAVLDEAIETISNLVEAEIKTSED